MPHDNVKACEDVFGKLQDNHMMSPTLIQINRTSPWSPCSAAIITEFLDGGHGEFPSCLILADEWKTNLKPKFKNQCGSVSFFQNKMTKIKKFFFVVLKLIWKNDNCKNKKGYFFILMVKAFCFVSAPFGTFQQNRKLWTLRAYVFIWLI